MSENLNRDFSKYEAMETEELEEILRLDAEAPEGVESDTELLLYILGVLASRRNMKNITGNTAQKAWESFEENYMPKKPQEPIVVKKLTPWLRRLTAAAAIVALLIVIPFSAKALNLKEIYEFLTRWVNETFSFVHGTNTEIWDPSPNDEDNYINLQELLQENNRDSSMVPTWIPKGFVLEKVEKDITPIQEIYYARYAKENSTFFIRIHNHLTDDVLFVETNQDYSEIYPIDGVNYYIFINFDQTQAIWIFDSYECTISGNLSVNEIKLMIDSIEKG